MEVWEGKRSLFIPLSSLSFIIFNSKYSSHLWSRNRDEGRRHCCEFRALRRPPSSSSAGNHRRRRRRLQWPPCAPVEARPLEVGLFHHSGGSGGEDRVLWGVVEFNNVFDQRARTVNGYGGCQCEYLEWGGVFLPILGAVVADSFIGKYYTIVASSLIYILVCIPLPTFWFHVVCKLVYQVVFERFLRGYVGIILLVKISSG